MVMKNKFYPIIFKIFLALLILASTSCKKYLDVQPEDAFLEKQVYSNTQSIRNVLNGVYLKLAGPSSYGQSLTRGTIDVMAQYYSCADSKHPYYSVRRYQYNDQLVKDFMANIWNENYSIWLTINSFIYNVSLDKTVLTEKERNLMLGEAYGLRAYIGLDMLRLFGPVYAKNSEGKAIPYPLKPVSEIHAILNASQVAELILKDIGEAELLLKDDPILLNGIVNDGSGTDVFFSRRNRRMNALAVKLLKARTLLYTGNRSKAHEIAVSSLAKIEQWFHWSPSELTLPGVANPDRVFSSEVIFGLDNPKLYEIQKNLFAATLEENKILYPLPARLNDLYENQANDYRFRSWFAIDPLSNRAAKVFFKYADLDDKKLARRYLQPLMKLSELYYILSETDPDPVKALDYLNTVRNNRGLSSLAAVTNLQDQLTREYQKEFWGEGQLFFYYKRINQAQIKGGSQANEIVNMGDAVYTVPLPLSETSPR
jgi:hypothetical protein